MERKKIVMAGAATLALSLMLSACGGKGKEETAAAEIKSSETGTGEEEGVFGKFTSETLEGEEVDQEIFGEAELTMVNIWGTFCGPCIQEMPDLGEISREYKDKGVQIVGMISDVVKPADGTEPDTKTAEEIVETTNADYTHILLSEDLYRGYLGEVQAVPTTVFVDQSGAEVGVYTGSRSKEEWVSIIEEMLNKAGA